MKLFINFLWKLLNFAYLQPKNCILSKKDVFKVKKKKQNAKQSIRIWLWVSVKIPTDTYWIKRFCGTGGTRSVGKPRFTGMTDYYHYSCCTIIYTDILILVFNYVVNETLLEKYKGLPSLFNKKVCFSIEFAQRTTFGRFLLSLIIVTNRSSDTTIYTEWSLSL